MSSKSGPFSDPGPADCARRLQLRFRSFLVSKFVGFLVSKFLGLLVSKFQRFTAFLFRVLLGNVDPRSKIFKNWLDGSSGLFGARLLQVLKEKISGN